MRRRSKAGGKVTKTQFRRTLRRHAKTKVAGRRKPSAVDATERIALLEHRLNEAVEQQSATSEVLRVIASSPSEIQSVLDGIAAAAARLLDVADADIMRVEGQLMRCVAKHGPSPQWEIGSTRAINRDWVTGRAVIDRKTVHVRDLQAAESEFPEGAAYAKRYGHRTTLATPLLREGNPIGAFLIRRSYVKPFTNEQIELVQNFAAQAVIAIENARLLNELRESLQQQTATADVLKAISRSTFDLQTVLNTLTESAAGLCEADVAAIIRQRGTANYWATSYGLPPEHSERIKSLPIVPGRGTVVARVLLEGHTVHVPDVLADSEYTFFQAQKIVGFRTALGVPLLREGSPIGVLALMRCSVRPFTDKQIELVETFADQAVIAIENVRLFDEVQTRTRDLTESLQQQTATADVLKVISRSTFDLQTVLGALIETATRLCNADQGAISREIDGAFFRSAGTNGSELYRGQSTGRRSNRSDPRRQDGSRIHIFARTGFG
jgi:GAF domain-containing protein